jgi:molybdopterin-guanine dinucleotide biosynthesis protein
MTRYFFSSLTRISDLKTKAFEVQILPRKEWGTGDYVLGEVISPVPQVSQVELTDGRQANVLEGDLIIGAFGVRRATLEAVGDWQSIGEDNQMENMTAAGLFGKVTSKSFLLPPLTSLIYRGHLCRNYKKISMKDFVVKLPETPYKCPTIMIIGTSMSAGKTTTARIIIHELKGLGLKVIGAKLTGAGRYRDILAMGDAGADKIFDFVDVGLPSSIVPAEEFRSSLQQLLTRIASEKPDIAVVEAGASPLEPYNGSIVLEEMKEQIICTVLCASDPYAVVGVSQSFDLVPDFISGVATNTTAGVELVEKMTGIKALMLSERSSLPELRQLLQEKLTNLS